MKLRSERGWWRILGVAFSVFALWVTACGTTDRVSPVDDVLPDTTDAVDSTCEPCGITGEPPTCSGNIRRLPRQVQDPVTCVCTTAWEEQDCEESGQVCVDGQCRDAMEGCTSDEACVGTSAPQCDGNEMVVVSGFCDREIGECASRETRTACPLGCEEGVCREEAEGTECREDGECPFMGRPQCVSDTELRGHRGRCTLGRCTLEDVITQCPHGCGPQDFGVDGCEPEPPCPDDPCEGAASPSYCTTEEGMPVWVKPEFQRELENDCACREVELRWLCGLEETCEPDNGCLRECPPCPVLRPGPPVCEGDVSVQLVDIELNPETCACEEVFLRRDCSAENRRCEDGECVGDRDP